MTAGFKLDTLLKVVTRELISYITRQRQSNVADVEIKADLQKGGWTIDDINLAFLQINAPTSPVPTPPSPNNQTVLHPLGAGVKPQDDPKIATEEIPAIVKIVSISILMIAISTLMSGLMNLANIVMMDYSFSNMGLAVSIAKSYPGYGLLSIITVVGALYMFYVGLKVFNGSRFSFFLGLFSLLIVPFGLTALSIILITPFVNDLANIIERGGETATRVTGLSIDQFISLENIVVVVCILLLIISYKKFRFINTKFPTLAKYLLIAAFILLVIPVSSYVAFRYFQPVDTDNGYMKVRSEVDYPVYRPSYVPGGLVVVTNFKIDDKPLVGKDDAVEVVYDTSFGALGKGAESRIINIKQVGVEPGFDLLSYVTSEFMEGTLSEINLSNSINGTGYSFQKTIEGLNISGVSFITFDNVLITMVGLKIDETEIIKMAESMDVVAVGME